MRQSIVCTLVVVVVVCVCVCVCVCVREPNRLQNLLYEEAFSASAEACPCVDVHAAEH